jgi:hypothetical protein
MLTFQFNYSHFHTNFAKKGKFRHASRLGGPNMLQNQRLKTLQDKRPDSPLHIGRHFIHAQRGNLPTHSLLCRVPWKAKHGTIPDPVR